MFAVVAVLLYLCLSTTVSAAPRQPVADYDLYSTRLTKRNKDSGSLSAMIKYFALGATFYVGNRLAHFIDSKFVSKGNLQSTSYSLNMTVVDDMRKEQEELWRIVYSMSEGQAEKMSSLTRTFDGKIREIETLLSDLTDKISSKIAAIEQALEQVPDMETKLSTLQSAVSQVASDMSKYENTMAAIKESIPKLLASHDTKVIERLKAFSAEVKDILKSK